MVSSHYPDDKVAMFSNYTNTPSVLRHARVWNPPSVGFVKLNTDFAISGEGGLGFGVIVRDHEGKVLMVATGWEPGAFSLLEGETQAIIWALQLVSEVSFHSMKVEMDNLMVTLGIK